MTTDLIPVDRPADVVQVEDLRDKERRIAGGTDAAAYETASPRAAMMDPITATLREDERQRAAGPRASSVAPDAPLAPFTDNGYPLVSRADGPLAPADKRHGDLIISLNQTVRVDTDAAVVYGVKVGAHDLRVKRVFVR